MRDLPTSGLSVQPKRVAVPAETRALERGDY